MNQSEIKAQWSKLYANKLNEFLEQKLARLAVLRPELAQFVQGVQVESRYCWTALAPGLMGPDHKKLSLHTER